MEREFFVFPASFAQQRLWFLDQYEPGSAVYNIPDALRLVGKLNVGALEQSLKEIVARHESLRTTFSMVEGEPVQVITPSVNHSLVVIDLRERPQSEREEEARRLSEEEARRPFDLVRGPLFRSNLLRPDEDDYVLLLTMHHIVSDGWSIGVLHRELSVLYEAFSRSQASPLPELPIQYADYAVWQREWLQGEELERQLSYWKKQLEGIPGVLNLPMDHPRPAVQSYRGAQRSIEPSKELTEELKALSRKEGVTLFMTLLAAFQTLLCRYTVQEDIVVGSPIANRNRAEIEGLIGFFVNTLVLRTNFSGNPSFKELLSQVRETALGAYTHQDLPFEKLVEELKPERSLSHPPLFQVMFVLQNAPGTPLTFEGLSASPVRIGPETAKFDLILSLHDDVEGLRGSLEYNTALFDAATMTRMLEHFQVLLKGIVSNPAQRISDLPMLSEAEKHQLLIERNDTQRDYPRDKCIHERFEAQVEKSPDAVAVTFADEQLSYRELNARANQLAHYLRKQGVGPDVLVAICVERSLEMMVGLLGILKAGGAYLSLDPAYPKERLAFMLQDAQVSTVLTQQRLTKHLPKDGATVVYLDKDWEFIVPESEENPVSVVTPDELAYVIYTSGSTGKPKGVGVPHRGVLRLLFGVEYAQLSANETFLHLAPISFDASTFEIWGALLHGATCILCPGTLSSPKEIRDLLHRYKVSTLWLTASLFNAVIDETPEALAGVRQLLIGGEALSVPHVQRAVALLPHTRIINGYGPTESTTFTCCYPIPARLDESINSIPIGRPIANTEVYVLDSHLSPVPIGVRGELYIGGAGLARGYLNRPELTAERFIPNPFSTEPGARLYKTGDLARYLPDGNIEFLGRIDNQVKVRGFRIELGEIEAVLSQYPGVKEAVVVAREDMPGDRRLVSYVVVSRELAPTTSELRGFLRQQLPEYMVPSAFVFVDSLPLSPNGKIDRRALPVPDQTRPEQENPFVAPHTPLEELLAGIWAELLRVEKVGIHDNFFDLGGHSLLAAQLISRVRDAFHVEVPLRSLFEAPTVAGLAERIKAIREGQSSPATLPILPVSSKQESPLSFSQQRFWLLNQLQPNSFIHNCTYGFRLKGPLKIKALQQTLEEIVRRHEALRTTFSMSDRELVQRVAEQCSVKLPIVDLTELQVLIDSEVQRRFENEFHRPFNLASDLMLRATILRLDDTEHVLMLTIHHIAFDHWSIKTLYRELSVIYEACLASRPCPLPEPPIQYSHYAIWQREMFNDAALANQLAYWKQQLSDSPPMLNLPTDYPRPPVQTFRGGQVTLSVPEALADALKALSRKAGVTLFMTLLAAFKVLLHRLSGQDDIVVGSPVAGRDRSETENLIGLFLNTLALRTNLSGDPTFRELLTRVREMALGAYDHRDLPFEKVVEELKPSRDLNRTPLFQVFFNLYNFEEAKLNLDGLSVEPLFAAEPVSNFDLTLYVRECEDATRLFMVYNADLFGEQSMTGFLQQYVQLLEQVVKTPEKPIRSYSLVTPDSLSLLPDPSSALDEPPQQLVTSLFASWANQTPNQPAVSQGSQTWTYQELSERAETLARVLMASGLKPGDVVGTYGLRSFGLIAGMIGILLSGAVLLPIDHALPNQRKQLMLREAGAKKLLYVGDKRFDDAWLERNFAPSILVVDPVKGTNVDVDAGLNLELVSFPELSPDDPAYIFFTSGTTGIPKGVLGCHKGLSHFLNWQRETFGIEPRDRSAQLTALSFDAVLRDIFLPLTSGATLCLPEFSDTFSPDETIGWLEREQISVLHTVPSVAQSWLANSAEKISLPSLRRVFFVGEPLTDTLVLRWRAAFQNAAEIVNLYGPTESTLVKCFYRVPTDLQSGVQPVGRAIPEAQALVLAPNNQLCGINEPGEIVLRTPFRSLGYINAPEENRKRFAKNPFRDDAHDLIYFTGDAGRYAPDGTLEILGRLDDQVKIHGVRIEPAEVTAILAQHPCVESCIVVGRKDKGAETDLVAYVVASKQGQPTSTQLRSYLLEQLPAAMVPSAFVFLDSLPLTPNGKVDRKALPEPDDSSEPEENFVAPRTAVEQMLAAIWVGVLKREKIGINDNFFDLGGHSLLATQIVSRISKTLRVELPLRALFEKPTVASLSDLIETIRGTGKENQLTSKGNLGETEEITL